MEKSNFEQKFLFPKFFFARLNKIEYQQTWTAFFNNKKYCILSFKLQLIAIFWKCDNWTILLSHKIINFKFYCVSNFVSCAGRCCALAGLCTLFCLSKEYSSNSWTRQNARQLCFFNQSFEVGKSQVCHLSIVLVNFTGKMLLQKLGNRLNCQENYENFILALQVQNIWKKICSIWHNF